MWTGANLHFDKQMRIEIVYAAILFVLLRLMTYSLQYTQYFRLIAMENVLYDC